MKFNQSILTLMKVHFRKSLKFSKQLMKRVVVQNKKMNLRLIKKIIKSMTLIRMNQLKIGLKRIQQIYQMILINMIIRDRKKLIII